MGLVIWAPLWPTLLARWVSSAGRRLPGAGSAVFAETWRVPGGKFWHRGAFMASAHQKSSVMPRLSAVHTPSFRDAADFRRRPATRPMDVAIHPVRRPVRRARGQVDSAIHLV